MQFRTTGAGDMNVPIGVFGNKVDVPIKLAQAAPRVAHIVEIIGPIDVPTHTPAVLIPCSNQTLGTQLDLIQVAHLPRAMVQAG